jgi:superfamily II DNA or RNA helicase
MGYYSIDLESTRTNQTSISRKVPFEHQIDAFEALTKNFIFEKPKGIGGLLVLPTGGGKTFTSVKWVCDNVVPKNIKILWMANSFYLLDQAFQELFNYAKWIPGQKKLLNIRLVSSNPSHESPSSIEDEDDILIMTTQTAIKNLHTQAQRRNGGRAVTRFNQWLRSSEKNGLFIVLDEAHHAPAFGCRNLLIGKDEKELGIRELIPNANLLGLTATPTYADQNRKGWLGKIFEAGILYQADKVKLTAAGILSRPNYIQLPTGKELTVSDELFTSLVRDHKDLPEEIIEKLANDHRRNDYIVNEYVQNRTKYGKTIIFADRWYQCVYLKTKLEEKGVRADAIYSKIDADPGSAEGRNKRTASDNQKILEVFKSGKDSKKREKLEVLINVRMLTEGADVPSVSTVFITRQTTSQILMAQMIGRALRGTKAGGSDEAFIVMFMDEWKRLIDWATPTSLDGGLEETRVTRGSYPLEYVSIRLVEDLSRQINSGGELPPVSFSKVMPIGWFKTDYTVSTNEENNEETQSLTEFVMVYEETLPKFEKFISFFSKRFPDGWDREFIDPNWMIPQVESWIKIFFDRKEDDIGNTLVQDLIRIARHLSQNQNPPPLVRFEEREKYNLDEIARKRLRFNFLENNAYLENEFNKPGNLWRVFYRSFERFSTAFNGAAQRAMFELSNNSQVPALPAPRERRKRELTESEKEQVKIKDGRKCLCCGKTGKGSRLQVDHVVPYNLGGETSIENSQTLCSVCNRQKNLNDMNFIQTESPLRSPKKLELLPRERLEDYVCSITRLVNYFYSCRAVCALKIHKRTTGSNYACWEIHLYNGNDPQWLNQYKRALIKHIRENFKCTWVLDLKILGKR